MPEKSWTHYRAKIAALSREHGPADPKIVSARRDLKVARLADRIRADVAEWPPLTDEQRERLAALLQPTSWSRKHASCGDAA